MPLRYESDAALIIELQINRVKAAINTEMINHDYGKHVNRD